MLGTARQYFFVGSVVATIVAGCGENVSAPPEAGYRPGPEGQVSIVALDEVTRAPLAGVSVEVMGEEGVLGTATTDAEGRAIVAITELHRSVTLRGPDHVAERWSGTGREIVMPLQRRASTATVSETLEAAPPGDWTIVASSPARVLHAASLAMSSGVACVGAGEGRCSFTLETPVEATTSFFAFRSEAGIPVELRALGAVEAGTSLTDAQRFEITDIDVSIPDPGDGSTAVVGVPGIAVNGRVAVLPWPMAEGSMWLPDTDEAFGSAWALFSTTLPDGSTSVLVRRGADGDLDAWTAWLAAPAVDTTAGLVVTTPTDAELLAIAWYAGAELLQNDLHGVLGLAGGLGGAVDVPDGATSAVVRAIDTTGVEVGSLSLDLAERSVTRIAERTVALP
jgi:hypothetical protein